LNVSWIFIALVLLTQNVLQILAGLAQILQLFAVITSLGSRYVHQPEPVLRVTIILTVSIQASLNAPHQLKPVNLAPVRPFVP